MKKDERHAEWSLVRRAATLGDVVDETTFVSMMGVPLKTFRHYHSSREAYGIEFPLPIARPEGMKPIWLMQEATDFLTKFKAARATRHVNGIDYKNRRKRGQ